MKELYAELEELGAKHIQDSVWAVTAESTAEQVFDALWAHMHQPKDRLLVAATGGYKNINGITRFKDA